MLALLLYDLGLALGITVLLGSHRASRHRAIAPDASAGGRRELSIQNDKMTCFFRFMNLDIKS